MLFLLIHGILNQTQKYYIFQYRDIIIL